MTPRARPGASPAAALTRPPAGDILHPWRGHPSFLGLNGLGLGAMAPLRAAMGDPATTGPSALLPGLTPNIALTVAGWYGLRAGLALTHRAITRGYRKF